MLSLSAEVSNQVADQSHDHSVDGGDSPWKDVCYDSAEYDSGDGEPVYLFFRQGIVLIVLLIEKIGENQDRANRWKRAVQYI